MTKASQQLAAGYFEKPREEIPDDGRRKKSIRRGNPKREKCPSHDEIPLHHRENENRQRKRETSPGRNRPANRSQPQQKENSPPKANQPAEMKAASQRRENPSKRKLKWRRNDQRRRSASIISQPESVNKAKKNEAGNQRK